MSEPVIIINGRVLSVGEAMAVRVAVCSFRVELEDPEEREALGEELAAAYRAQLLKVERTMLATN